MIARTLFSVAAMLVVSTVAVNAQDAPSGDTSKQTTTETPKEAAKATDAKDAVTLELNKLEPSQKGCRAYVVVSNPTSTTYDAYKLDLVMFQKDGVIGRRFALDLAPLRPSKRSVKLFELDGTKCEDIGSFLVNDVMAGRADGASASDCLSALKVNSLTKVEISK
jgi:hypothetical protein